MLHIFEEGVADIDPFVARVLTPAEAADRLGISVRHLNRLVVARRVRYIGTECGRMYDPAVIEQLARHRTAAKERRS